MRLLPRCSKPALSHSHLEAKVHVEWILAFIKAVRRMSAREPLCFTFVLSYTQTAEQRHVRMYISGLILGRTRET